MEKSRHSLTGFFFFTFVETYHNASLKTESFHHDLLCLHVVAVDETQHVNARRSVDGLADAAIDGLAAEDASVDINHLQDGLAIVADDPVAVAEEREAVASGFVAVGTKYQAETALIVRRLGGESVRWRCRDVACNV